MNRAEEERLAAWLRGELTNAVRAVTPHWLRDRCDDIVQNAVIKVLAVVERNEGEQDFAPSYLCRVAYTAMIDEIRRVHPERYESMEAVLENNGGMSFVSSDPDPSRRTSSHQLGAEIQSCLEALASPRRRAVTLYLYGYGVPEAARLMGWSRKRTENLVYRGVADLRRCLRTKGLAP